MHDTRRHEHHNSAKSHSHEHHAEGEGEKPSEIMKLRKMVEHWVGHNEEHARSYRSWADRAREAGFAAPGEILDKIASKTVELNQELEKIVVMIDSGGSPD